MNEQANTAIGEARRPEAGGCLRRYGCGCIGYTGPDGTDRVISSCDAGDQAGEYNYAQGRIDAENLPGVPLTPEAFDQHMRRLCDLAAEGYAARELIGTFEFLQRLQARGRS
jgi:hypothetical protein